MSRLRERIQARPPEPLTPRQWALAAAFIGILFALGWVYVVYLVTVFDLWSKLRWRVGRLATMAAAGVVPVMSFVLERTVHTQALARIEAAGGARG